MYEKQKALMLSLLCMVSVFCPITTYSEQVNDSKAAKQELKQGNSIKPEVKNLSEKEVISSIAKIIEPVKPKQENIDINYGFGASKPINLAGNLSQKADFNIKVEDDTAGQSYYNEAILRGYKASLAGHYEAAIFLYKKALVSGFNNVDILYNLGIMYHKLKQFKEAEDYYRQVLRIQPDHKKALHNFLAVIGEESPEKGLKELKQLNKVNPNYSPVLAQIGMIYAKQGNYDEAEKYLRKAIIISPHEILYKYNLAVMYDKLDKYKSALKLYQEVLDLSDSGETLPQSLETIKQRVNFLTSR